MRSKQKVKLGIIGCGWVVRRHHLPAIAACQHVDLVSLADIDADAAGQLAREYGVPHFTQDYAELFDQVDAVLVALPPALHAQVSSDCLGRGIHVLCEKPMATSLAEGQQMVNASKEGTSVLAVGQIRRHFDNNLFIHHALSTGILGNVTEFQIRETSRFDLLGLSDNYLRREQAGAGVLCDIGVHVFDLLLWWFGDVADLRYWDDNRGGVEANACIELQMSSGVRGNVELSRTRRLSDTIQLIGTDLEFTLPVHQPARLGLRNVGLDLRFEGGLQGGLSSYSNEWDGVFARQLDDFALSALGHRQPTVDGTEGLRSIAVIERCLAVRQELPQYDWELLDDQ